MIIGVLGAGTMGAGIAQLGCMTGSETRLHDPIPEALEKGSAGVAKGLAKFEEKGKLLGPVGELVTCDSMDGLAGCDIVIEAAPERADLKRQVFAEISEVCGPETVIATNTSSFTVTSLAGAAANPENVVGMHFFNPPPLMKLVEVIRADRSSDSAVALAMEVAAAMGRTAVLAIDGPGFIVNRCGRPFYTEGLRLLTERIATHDEIDRIYRLGGGFRMGPFELMDLVGIDVGFEVAKNFMELSFGEPRWKPSPIQAKMVAAGRLGRKSGRGYYDYSQDPYRPEDGEVEPAEAPAVAIAGDDPGAARLRAAVARGGELEAELVSCATQSLARQKQPAAIGFILLPESGLVELIRGPEASDGAVDAAERLARATGLHHQWVGDAPGGVLGRVLACNVNEALFALGEGVASREDLDTGLKLGLNHPHGPLEWGDVLGLELVREILDGVWQERREERYRPAPLLV